jgi:hypothetical protein
LGWEDSRFLLRRAILVGVAFFAVDRFQATFTPHQYAAAKAVEQAEAVATAAREAEVQKEADAKQAEVDKAERKKEIAYNQASDALANFKMSLRDPEAARFRDVWMVRGQLSGAEIVAVCGAVNAPNAFGAYTGETAFIAAGHLSYTPEHPSFAGLFQTLCLDGDKVMEMH